MTTPITPPPDDKDWTWAIREPCPDCRFDPSAVQHADVPALIHRYTGTVGAALGSPDGARRRQPAVWSPLEYGCHVRDVCDLFGHRLHRMLTEDDPLFENWDQDVTAIEQRYWTQDPAAVAIALRDNAERIADAFAAVDGDQWQRPGRRSNGSEFTVDTFARYFLHDLAHHAWDVSAA